MERRGRMDCPALPPGWKKEEVIRKSGLSAGKSDVYYFSPSGKKFRSKPQLARYLGNTVDLSSFDFRTGKMMPSKLQKNKQRLRNDSLNQNKGKPDLNTTLPIRQTASIFKQPVTKVTNHPSNKVRSDPQRVTEQPRQVSWQQLPTKDGARIIMRLRSSSCATGKGFCFIFLPVSLHGLETLSLPVIAACLTASELYCIQLWLKLSSQPWTATENRSVDEKCQNSYWLQEQFHQNRKQEERVHQVRKKLEEALMADILSRAADTTKDMDVEMDNGDDA
ncbi:methyl-CpG-binding domain protein 2 [Gopherus flavomarginatus]|uniref:methyl-CpG-binding domain protein 2 n=1 Tax=Gopherus flavomarginatus TaxID=286002 RepID=UPI0021CC3D81|nr:methyl-CpG-binding domain protein 2 [Gopherus flavomarginatus]